MQMLVLKKKTSEGILKEGVLPSVISEVLVGGWSFYNKQGKQKTITVNH